MKPNSPSNKSASKVTDYHDFTTIKTPVWKRKRLDVGDLWINGATCNLCGEYIRSRNRHDYVTCRCGNLAVDGGSWYAKRVLDVDNYSDNIVGFKHPRPTQTNS